MSQSIKKQGQSNARNTRPGAVVFEALEPRLLLSADPLAGAISDALTGPDPDDPDWADGVHAAANLPLAADPESALPGPLDLDAIAGLDALADPAADVAAETPRVEVLFVDPGVPDYQQLLDSLGDESGGRHIEVVVLDGERDGVDQITEALAAHGPVDAVHILSHASADAVQVGAT